MSRLFSLSRNLRIRRSMSTYTAQKMAKTTHSVTEPSLDSRTSAWITPAVDLEPSKVDCSAIENLCSRVWPTPTYFFPNGRNEDPLKQYSHLARGLSRILNRLPFLAGVLRTNERGSWSIEIPRPPQAGVRFHYVDLSDDPSFPSFPELRKAGFPFADGNMDGLAKLRPDPLPVPVDGCPVLLPQLTHLQGGFVLTVSHSHLIADLSLFSEICDNWANEAHEVSMAAIEDRSERPVPMPVGDALTDRTRLSPPCSGTDSWKDLAEPSKAIPEWTLVDPTNPVTLENLKSTVPPASIPPSLLCSEKHLRTTISGVWRFPAASLKALKSAAQNASPTGTRISTMDALIAYLWQRFFVAKYAPSNSPSEEQANHVPKTSQIVFARDVRRLLNPPMPKGYLPACVDLGRCSADSASLPAGAAADPTSLATLATSIREAIGVWSEEKYMTLLSLSQRTPSSPGFVPRGPIDLLCTDHSRASSLREADWGPGLGVSVACREPYVAREPPAGEVTVLPRCGNGDLEVMISGERIVLERLQGDAELRERSKEVFVLHDVGAESEWMWAR